MGYSVQNAYGLQRAEPKVTEYTVLKALKLCCILSYEIMQMITIIALAPFIFQKFKHF